MFKCKECGAEYEEKPDYCDCGNDEFVQTEEEKQPVQQSVKINADKIMPDKKMADEKPKPQPATSFSNKTFTPPPRKMTFEEKYPSLSRMIKSLDPVSLAIFSICLVFSCYIIFFAWNPDTTNVISEEKTEITVPKNIPSIDKIWNNALPVYKALEPKHEQKEDIKKQIIQVVQPEKQTPKIVQPAVQPKVTKVPLKKVTTTSKPVQTTKAVTKSQTNTAALDKAKKEADEKARQEALAKQKAEQERKAAEAAQLKKLQAELAKKAEAEKQRQQAANKQEYLNYKAQLRNTIGRKIDFTRVIGDGSCSVAFKIDPTGRLINRSFAKQSTNNTLNDAVYNAIMSTPTFNPPPGAYNNETLNLNIRFYNGNFEISLQ